MSSQGGDVTNPEPGFRGAVGRLRLVWKVNGLFLLILVASLSISVWVTNMDFREAELEAAREISIVSSERILDRIRGLMMSHSAGTLASEVNQLASENPAFRNIRLISHDGRVLASQFLGDPRPVSQNSWPCTHCHQPAGREEGPVATEEACCEVRTFPDGERALSVVTPIIAREGCSSADCHSDAAVGSVMALLQADYSLARVDALIAQRNRNTALAIIFALLLGTVATWFVTERLLGRRIRALKEGARRLSEHDLSFRFSDSTGDGLAEVMGVLDTMTSELSDALTELMSTKEYLEAIVETSADIIITVGPQGRIRTFNPGAEKALGYYREEVIGKPIEMLFADPQEREVAIKRLDDTDHVMNYLTHFVTKRGEVRDVMLTLSRLRTPDGTPIGTMGVSKDITEELKMQRQLHRSQRMAALGEAITGVQHSIKNMLNVMKGGSYMLKLGLKKEDMGLIKEGWGMVQEGIDDMTEMSMGMLDFARTRKLNLKSVDFGELAKRAHSHSLSKYREAGVKLELDVAPDLPPVRCDSDGIRSVVMDLLGNALDACSWKEYGKEEEPAVTLRVVPSDDEAHIQIEVQDNGVGMSEEVKRRVFAPFFSTKDKKGTGMGLAVVSKIVESHQGTTSVESKPGRGSTFKVSLPTTGPSVREEAVGAQESSGR